jgi:hypothetical protein
MMKHRNSYQESRYFLDDIESLARSKLLFCFLLGSRHCKPKIREFSGTTVVEKR